MSELLSRNKYKSIELGDRFSRLTVVAEHDERYRGEKKFICLCDCGQIKVVRASSLKNNHTTSCGCYRKEKIIKHGMCDTFVYFVWKAMINRCCNKNNCAYPSYGARGITVCERW